jgi:hypothetical protein
MIGRVEATYMVEVSNERDAAHRLDGACGAYLGDSKDRPLDLNSSLTESLSRIEY